MPRPVWFFPFVEVAEVARLWWSAALGQTLASSATAFPSGRGITKLFDVRWLDATLRPSGQFMAGRDRSIMNRVPTRTRRTPKRTGAGSRSYCSSTKCCFTRTDAGNASSRV